MLIDIKKIPFSKYGSYLAISDLPDDFEMFGMPVGIAGGLYLKTVRGDTMMNPIVGRLLPLEDGKPISYEYEVNEAVLKIKTDRGIIRITYADSKTLLIEGIGENIGMRLDDLDVKGVFDFIHEIPYKGNIYYEVNLYKNQNKFLCAAQEGVISMKQVWIEKTASDCSVEFNAENGRFLAVIEEEKKEWSHREFSFDFNKYVQINLEEFRCFLSKLPSVPAKHEGSRELAGYILWANTVRKEMFLGRDTIYASKNWMLSAFSWDQCFPAMALAYANPDLAWDQFMIMFDHQDVTGRVPDLVTNREAHWNHCKPPVFGWALLHMMEHMTLNMEQKEEAYRCLGKWTNWWYTYRDCDEDGNCEYYHGNDSGWDNSTAFRLSPTVVSPDLAAYLVLQTEALGVLARDLGKLEESVQWEIRSKKQLNDMLAYNFYDGKPVVRVMRTGEVVKNGSLLPYMSIILGKRLPKYVRDSMIRDLKEDGFLTEWGVATERTTSEFYEADGYWRGPIWAAPTVVIIEGLFQSGEKELAKELAEKFMKLIEKSGFSETYDAMTGEGRRDSAYTWTAAAYFLLGHEYLMN